MSEAQSANKPCEDKGPHRETAERGEDKGAGGACCPGPMMEQMKEMMAKMCSAENPMETCQEMMTKCQAMKRQMAGKCCP